MKHNRRILYVVGAILLIASLALVAFMLQPTAEELLIEAIQTMEGISDGHATIEVELTAPEMSGDATIEVWGKLEGPHGRPAFKAVVLEASEEKAIGVTAVSDGDQLWLWHPTENTVYVATAEEIVSMVAEKMEGTDYDFDHEAMPEHPEGEIPETAEEAVAKLLEYFTADRPESEDVGETAAYRIRLVPIPEQMPDEVRVAGGYLNVWVAAENRAPLAIEYAKGSMGEGKVAATSLEYNQGIDDSEFVFKIPEGATVINLADLVEATSAVAAVPPDFETLTPATLPEGATLIDTNQVRGAMVQRYSLPGGKSFTVAQGPAEVNYQPNEAGESVSIRGLEGTLFSDEDGSRTLLSWTDGKVSFWVGGDLTAADALVIAESLR